MPDVNDPPQNQLRNVCRRGRPRKHDWDTLFRRSRFVYVRGRDYTCSASNMVQQIRNAASFRRLSITLDEANGVIRVLVTLRQNRLNTKLKKL